MLYIPQTDTIDEEVRLASCYITAMELQLCPGHEKLEEWRR